jgi:TolB protein
MQRFFLVLLAIVTLAAAPARAELRVDITKGVAEPIPVAIVDFYAKDPAQTQAGADLASVVRANLERSGLFAPIDPSAFIQSAAALQLQPRFADWRALNAQALVSGAVELQPDGRLRVEFRLWDVLGEQQMVGLAYFTPANNWRRIAHIISDAVYKRITGEEGYFDTRIVYVAESGPATKRIKRLAIMDQDGANHRFLTDGRSLVLTPRFSPSTQEITYLAYYRNQPRVYLLNIDTGREEVLGDFPGMTFAPRFSPDGRRVVMSLSQDGNSNIYTMNLQTRQVRRVTDNPAIDTSPSYAPDEKQIVFNSDRGGTQQLYVMNADGSNVRRISFGRGRYATPVWSPRGDLIAFTKFLEGSFYIGVMRPDGTGERLLSESYLEEGPTWAPNGRVLMFYRQDRMDKSGQGARARLYSVDLTGRNLQIVPTPGDASDPAWSPLIP